MKAICLHDKREIERRLRREESLHLYELGDLDDFFWPHTSWYTLKDNPAAPVILLYSGQQIPTLMALETERVESMRELIDAILHLLPARVYSHLSDGLIDRFAGKYHLEPRGKHLKLALTDLSLLHRHETKRAELLTSNDLTELLNFYNRSNEANWFDPRMLETGCYFGIRHERKLVSVAGIHVYSPRYRIAVLGNVATDPEFRGQGMATELCALLCRHLLQTVDTIGLNVHENNQSALACYKKLGFAETGAYAETMLTLRISRI